MTREQSAIVKPESWTEALDLNSIFRARSGMTGSMEKNRRLEVEIGCGKGTFLLSRANAHRDTDFIAIDRMLKRLRRADSKVTRHGLDNVALLRIEAAYAIEYLIPDNSVDACFVLFPDPWPKKRHHRRRLFQESFLNSLAKTLKPGGKVHIATDHTDYFQWISEMFAASDFFEETEPYKPAPEEKTNFEIIFLQKDKQINRCSYKLIDS
ncbi:MAG: tRNA (guanosine(46)-N7)-methyltransferase TrmB [Verrucomicrobiota bacterium]